MNRSWRANERAFLLDLGELLSCEAVVAAEELSCTLRECSNCTEIRDPGMWSSAARHCGRLHVVRDKRLLDILAKLQEAVKVWGHPMGRLSSGLTGLATQGGLGCSTQAAKD